MQTVSDAIAAQIRHLGYPYPMEWLTRPFDYDSLSLSFEAGKPQEGGRKAAPKIVKRDQIADFERVLKDPNMRSSYRYIIAEEAGIDHARQAAANVFMQFMKRFLLDVTRDRSLKPPRWVVIDNELNQNAPADCGALFIDYVSLNSTNLRPEKARHLLSSRSSTCPVFLLCSGASPYHMISEKINASFDAYLFLRTELTRSL